MISPGIWNAEAGPDFLKAHLRIGNEEIRGDIEIDLDDQSWEQHKHHLDGRYDKVILHVSLWRPQVKRTIINSRNESVHQAYFESALTISQTRILQLIDLDKYPYRKFLGSGRCATTLFKTLPEEKVFDLFQSAAELRLAEKARYLKGHIEDQRLLLPAGIAMALGFKNNSEPFFELFLRLLKHKEESETDLISIALGMCGFFSDSYRKKWRNSPFYQNLFQSYSNSAFLFPHTISLNLNKVRPLNHPIRRIVYLVKLIKDPLMSSLYAEIYLCWHQYWPASAMKKEWSLLRQMFNDRLPTYTHDYWNQHYTFENEEQKQPLSLFGRDLKEIVIINTVLPLLYTDILQKNNLSEINAFRQFYQSFPKSNNSKTRYISHRFFGDSTKGKILQRAFTQQGAFQVYRDFCIHHEASCEGCSFVNKYKKMKTKKNDLV